MNSFVVVVVVVVDVLRNKMKSMPMRLHSRTRKSETLLIVDSPPSVTARSRNQLKLELDHPAMVRENAPSTINADYSAKDNKPHPGPPIWYLPSRLT
jgi:hypothetical protein